MLQRRGTATQWANANPTLGSGEIGFETDTGQFKMGDNSTAWDDLPYFKNIEDLGGNLDDYILLEQKGAANGVATLDGSNLIPTAQIPSGIARTADYVALTQKGAANGVASLDGSNLIPTAQIPTSIARSTDVGNLVANTVSDLEEYADFAAGNALSDAEDYTDNAVSNAVSTLETYADLAAGNALSDANEYTDNALTNLIGTAPNALNTLQELANAINDDQSYFFTVANNINNAVDAANEYTDNSISNLSADVTEQVELLGNNVANNLANAVSQLQNEIGNAQSAAEDYANGLVDQEILDRDTAIESQAFISGNALANAITDLEEYTDNAISDHNLETLNVHGISNTATLVTLTDLSNHETDTSNVHGITNTLAVVLTDDARLSDARTPLDNSVTNNSISGTINQDKITNLVTTLGNLASLSGAAFTGNVSTTGSLTVDGDFTVSGSNVIVSATQIQIEDTLLQLGHTNANNVADLGLVVSYNDGTQKHAGIVKDVTDGKWKLFDGVTSEPGTTVNFGQGSLDVLALLTLEANSVTATSDITANGIVFTDGTQRLEGVPSRTPIIQKTASYTLSALTERDDLIEMDSVSATTLTIPLNSAVAYPVGTSIDILQTNTGQVTIAGDAGVTVNATPGLKLRTRWSSCTLFKRATDTWVVYGDLSA